MQYFALLIAEMVNINAIFYMMSDGLVARCSKTFKKTLDF